MRKDQHVAAGVCCAQIMTETTKLLLLLCSDVCDVPRTEWTGETQSAALLFVLRQQLCPHLAA